jgi:ATP-dependent Clp protease ATP-binding subunit ClpA
MSQLTIKLSDKADALIAQLQKEIFNRRRKKVSASGVVETLVESGAKSQSDKRFATSWKNLISDIEKAAKLANAHGSKPANLSDAEWALVLSHRARSTGTAKSAAKPAAKRAAKAPAARKPAAKKAPAPAKASAASKPAAKAKPKPAKAARNPVKKTAAKGTVVKTAAKAKPAAARSSVARRMAKAVSRLNTSAPAAVSSNGAGQLTTVS